jgi:BolA protein
MSLTDRIKLKITEKLNPVHIELINDSHKHVGHAGDNGTGESHFRLVVVSEAFEGYNRIQRQRMVYAMVEDEFSRGLHAFSMKTLTPAEFKAK